MERWKEPRVDWLDLRERDNKTKQKKYVKNIQIKLNMLLTHQTAKLQKDTKSKSDQRHQKKPITSLALIRW